MGQQSTRSTVMYFERLGLTGAVGARLQTG